MSTKGKLNIEFLITILEDIDENLSLIWSECQNYDLLDLIENERRTIRNIINTLTNFVNC
jgi:hypothetical protein